MSNTNNKTIPSVLVLGGAGFAGRHAVAALVNARAKVTIGTRNPDRTDPRIPAIASECTRRQLIFETLTQPDDWIEHLHDVDVVLNCVGILRQRGASTYDNVHHKAPAALAAACANTGKRMVHLSALGLSPSARSRFTISKIAGEEKVSGSTADWIIARPSLLDGEGGFGARWLRGVARLPAFFTPSGARGRIAALDVTDLGDALARLCIADATALRLSESRIFELGGMEDFLFHDYIRALRKTYTDKPSLQIRVPNQLARLFSHVFDVIHFTPFSFGHWEMLQRDNKPDVNRLPELLQRSPKKVAPR